MRRSRRASRDSSQDSPVTDNERDIVWGDSPPARRLCLSVTPGKRMTRSVAAEQDLTDLIECVHPKENKESNTPPLLGLWMRNRGEPRSGKKKLKTARLTRRTTGRKLSRVGLDSLKVLSEWTGNLAAAIEESSAASTNEKPGSSVSGVVTPEGTVDECQEDIACDELQDLWNDEDVGDREYVPDEKQRRDGKRRSSNLSLTDDLWGNDDWYDDDSVIRIATQVENEALTQVKKQTEERASSVADVISPTQRGNNLLGKTRPPQGSLKNNTCVPHVSGKGQTLNKGVIASRFAPKTSERMENAAKIPVHDSNVCPRLTSQKTSQHFHGSGSATSQPSVVLLNKPVYSSQSNPGGYSSMQSNVKTVSKVASNVQSSNSSSISSMGIQKPIDVKNNSSYRSGKKPSVVKCTAQNRTITQAQSTSLPEAIKNRENTARVPPIPDIISHISLPSTSSKGIDDSLDDLFGDSSLPDDMLLELLDNDSDFEEYTKKPAAGQVAGTVETQYTRTPYPPEQTTQTRQPGLGAGKATASKTSGAPLSVMSSRQPANKTLRLHQGSQSHAHVAPKHSVSRGSCRNDSKALTNRMPPQSTVSHGSMATRSSARIATLGTAGASVNQSSAMFSLNSGDECEQGRKSLSQPTTPFAKKGGGMVHRFCSQQEIEKKRQEAIAKRKKRKLNVTAVS